MAQLSKISKVTLPSGTTYVIKDEAVWNALTEILGAPVWNETNQVYEFPAGNISNLEEITNIVNNYKGDQITYLTNINEAAQEAVATTFDTESSEWDGDALTPAQLVKDYVDSQVSHIHNFDVVIDSAGTSAGPSLPAQESNMYKLVLVPDEDASSGTYIEYILIRDSSVTPNTYTWEKIGSTKTDLTGYVSTEAYEATKIGTLELGADHTWDPADVREELGLGDLALKDEATGNVTIPAHDATGTFVPQGSITVEVDATASTATLESTGSYDKATDITGGDALVTDASINVTLTDAGNATAATLASVPINYVSGVSDATLSDYATGLTEVQSGGFLVEGTVSAPNITVTPSSATVSHVTNAGTAYTLSGGSAVKGNDTKAMFAKKVLQATAGSNETLVFGYTDAEPLGSEDDIFDEAVTAAGTVTYTAPTLAGALPTFEDVNALSGVSAALAEAPTFTGHRIGLQTGSKTVTIAATTASFNNVTGAEYLKQVIDTKTITLTKAANLGITNTATSITVTGTEHTVSDFTVTTATFTGSTTTATLTAPTATVSVTVS